MPAYAGPVRDDAPCVRADADAGTRVNWFASGAGLHLPGPEADQVEAMSSTVRANRNARDELSVALDVFAQAQALTTLDGGLAVAALQGANTTCGSVSRPGPAHPALDQPPAPDRGLDPTKPGGSRTPAAESVRAITDVVVAVRTRAALDSECVPASRTPRATPETSPAASAAHTPAHTHNRTRGVPMSHTAHPEPAPHAAGHARAGQHATPADEQPEEILGAACRALAADPGRARHLGRQHRAAVHRHLAAPRGRPSRWLVTAYLMMSGGGLLLGGRIADLLYRGEASS